MLAVLGFGTLISFMVLVMKRWATAFVAIIATPVVFAVLAGRGADIGEFALAGIETVAPTAVLLLFAVLYFGLMMELKLFDPLNRAILRASKGNPVAICVGTALMALIVALDGDGTTTYMIVVSAFLPLYLRLKMNPLIIAVVATMSLGLISGSTPWGGAATRGISVLQLDPSEYFLPLVPTLALTAVIVMGVGFVLGLRERKRVSPEAVAELRAELEADRHSDKTPVGWRMWFNFGLTVLLLVLLIAGVAPLVVLFMGAFVIALLVNVPHLKHQGDVIKRQAPNAVPVVMLVLAAGIFTGILTEAGMIQAMADTVLAVVPESVGGYFALITALISIPLGFFMSNDAFFFGILPVLAESAGQYGVSSEEILRAGVVGQMAHMIGPASAPLWVLLGLLGKELGDLHRFAIGWVVVVSLVMVVFAVLTGAIPLPLF